MELIAHRINKISQLCRLPEQYGVELDLRDDHEGRIYISHNPYEEGDFFEEYLQNYHHGTMILNIKSERIELEVLDLLKKYHIQKYFFLDSSFPMIYLLSRQGEHRTAIRVSEYEGMDTARNMAGLADWIWVDCFTRIPIEKVQFDELKSLGYKLCFVSPELQGRPEDIRAYRTWLEEQGMKMDAVCTKTDYMALWEQGENRQEGTLK